MSELPLKATLKAGGGYDAPWLTVDGAEPNDLDFKLQSIIEHPTLAQRLIEAAELLKATNAAGPILASASQPPTPQAVPPAPWENQQQGNTPPTPAPAWSTGQPQQQAAPAQSGGYQPHPNAVLHPEGKRCDFQGCGLPLEQKKTQNGKLKWQCGQWRWNNGAPNGHSMVWAD